MRLWLPRGPEVSGEGFKRKQAERWPGVRASTGGVCALPCGACGEKSRGKGDWMDGWMSLPELPDEEAVGKAAGVGLKDLMWFLFFGMPGEEAASLQ